MSSSTVMVPPRIAQQLERMSRVMQLQYREIDRLTEVNGKLQLENEELSNLLSKSDDEKRSLMELRSEQETLLSTLNAEFSLLLREKRELQRQLDELDNKYRQAKAASKEFARALEFEREELAPHFPNKEMPECKKSSRSSLTNLDKDTLKINEAEERENLIIMFENTELERRRLENELEKEKLYSESLLKDLQRNRQMVLCKDETLSELQQKLKDKELQFDQVNDQLSITESDLQMERGRCDFLTLALNESEQLVTQAQNDTLPYVLEAERMAENLRDANVKIVSLKAKLEAQGADLSSTKQLLKTRQLVHNNVNGSTPSIVEK